MIWLKNWRDYMEMKGKVKGKCGRNCEYYLYKKYSEYKSRYNYIKDQGISRKSGD
jgi:hypothetical protein